MLEHFTIDTFRVHLDQEFQLLLAGAESLPLQLIQVTDLSSRLYPPDGPGGQVVRKNARTPFSLVFRGPPQPHLPQRSYTFHHAGIGTFDLFIVPFQRDATGLCYEAIFT